MSVSKTINCGNVQRLLLEICEIQKEPIKAKIADASVGSDFSDFLSGFTLDQIIGPVTLTTEPKTLAGAINEINLIMGRNEISDVSPSVTDAIEAIDRDYRNYGPKKVTQPAAAEDTTGNVTPADDEQPNYMSLQEFCFDALAAYDDCNGQVPASAPAKDGTNAVETEGTDQLVGHDVYDLSVISSQNLDAPTLSAVSEQEIERNLPETTYSGHLIQISVEL